jgi:hypothetical protein
VKLADRSTLILEQSLRWDEFRPTSLALGNRHLFSVVIMGSLPASKNEKLADLLALTLGPSARVKLDDLSVLTVKQSLRWDVFDVTSQSLDECR